MTKRLFIAINLPYELKKELGNLKARWPDLDMRWIRPDNIHLTLFFLGETDIDEIPIIAQCCREALNGISSFKVELEQISLGPTPSNPRLVWVSLRKSEILEKLWQNLRSKLLNNSIHFENLNRRFLPHLTVARFFNVPRGFRDEKLETRFTAKSFELMESELRREGAEYTILESYKFKI